MLCGNSEKNCNPYQQPPIINAAKGFEDKTYKRLSQVIEEEIPEARIVVLSGPSHAEEVARIFLQRWSAVHVT